MFRIFGIFGVDGLGSRVVWSRAEWAFAAYGSTRASDPNNFTRYTSGASGGRQC